MKKISFLICVIFCLGILQTQAQYTNLHNFNDTNGGSPNADLIVSGNVLYGMTPSGGLNSDGCIFSINTNGSNYKDLFDFNGTNGSEPEGSLIIIGGRLYGITKSGGANSYGVIFSIDTNGSGFKALYNFNNTYGSFSRGSLTLSGKKFYGMAYQGGAHNGGCIFSVDTDGTGYKDMLDFNNTNGVQPTGSLIISGKVLYGMTSSISAYSGSIFAIDTDGTQFRELWLFQQFSNNDGAGPLGSLVLANGRLYGMTQQGGINQEGTVFGIDTDGAGYKKLIDLSCPIGDYPFGSLIISGNTLFGLTSQGGGYVTYGCIFSIDTNGTGYNRIYPFNAGAGGSLPYGSLVLSGNTLYGMDGQGGAHGKGVIFSYEDFSIVTTVGEVSVPTNDITISPNPSGGEFHGFYSSNALELMVTDITGRVIYEEVPNKKQFDIDLGFLQPGIYFISVTSLQGTLVKRVIKI